MPLDLSRSHRASASVVFGAALLRSPTFLLLRCHCLSTASRESCECIETTSVFPSPVKRSCVPHRASSVSRGISCNTEAISTTPSSPMSLSTTSSPVSFCVSGLSPTIFETALTFAPYKRRSEIGVATEPARSSLGSGSPSFRARCLHHPRVTEPVQRWARFLQLFLCQ